MPLTSTGALAIDWASIIDILTVFEFSLQLMSMMIEIFYGYSLTMFVHHNLVLSGRIIFSQISILSMLLTILELAFNNGKAIC